MLFDKFNTYASKADLTDFAGGVVGDVLDAGDKRRLGEGNPLYLCVHVSKDFTATGTVSVRFVVESSEDPTFPAGATKESLVSEAFAKEALKAGAIWYNHAPFGAGRYSRFVVKLEGGPLACGEVSAGLVLDVDTQANG